MFERNKLSFGHRLRTGFEKLDDLKSLGLDFCRGWTKLTQDTEHTEAGNENETRRIRSLKRLHPTRLASEPFDHQKKLRRKKLDQRR